MLFVINVKNASFSHNSTDWNEADSIYAKIKLKFIVYTFLYEWELSMSWVYNIYLHEEIYTNEKKLHIVNNMYISYIYTLINVRPLYSIYMNVYVVMNEFFESVKFPFWLIFAFAEREIENIYNSFGIDILMYIHEYVE